MRSACVLVDDRVRGDTIQIGNGVPSVDGPACSLPLHQKEGLHDGQGTMDGQSCGGRPARGGVAAQADRGREREREGDVRIEDIAVMRFVWCAGGGRLRALDETDGRDGDIGGGRSAWRPVLAFHWREMVSTDRSQFSWCKRYMQNFPARPAQNPPEYMGTSRQNFPACVLIIW